MTTRTITIPAGTVLVLDIKTGGMKVDYWHKYAPQLAAYAAAVPYDPETDTRSTWPWPIYQDVALIAHIPVADLLATGRCDISLVPVDLAAGRHAAELCVAAKAWNARRDVFGTPVPVVTAEVAPLALIPDDHPDSFASNYVPQPDPFDGINGEATADLVKGAGAAYADKLKATPRQVGKVVNGEAWAEVAPLTPASVAKAHGWPEAPGGHLDALEPPADPFDGINGEATKPGADKHGIVAVDVTRRRVLVDRAATLKATHPDAAKWVAARWPQGVPALKGDAPLTDADLDAIDAILTQAEAHFAAPFGDHDVTRPTPTARPVDPPQRATWQRPEEGPTIHDDEVAELRASIKRLRDNPKTAAAAARVQRWLGDAQANGRNIMPADGKHTMRSQSIIQAMANCALVDDFVGDDEFLRVVLAATLGTDAAGFANVSIGACFGSLTIAEAERLRIVAERYFDGKVTVGPFVDDVPTLVGELDGLGVAA